MLYTVCGTLCAVYCILYTYYYYLPWTEPSSVIDLQTAALSTSTIQVRWNIDRNSKQSNFIVSFNILCTKIYPQSLRGNNKGLYIMIKVIFFR